MTSVLLVSFGRISDMFGRVGLFNPGFVIFAMGSLLRAATSISGDPGASELTGFRVIQDAQVPPCSPTAPQY